VVGNKDDSSFISNLRNLRILKGAHAVTRFAVQGLADVNLLLRATLTMNVKRWIKKLGFWGFMFFLVKGLLWLTIPALLAFFAAN